MLKKLIRSEFKESRQLMTAEEREQAAADICSNAIQSYDFTNKNISIFLPIERHLEINTWHFIDKIQADFYLPVLKNDKELKHVKFENKAQIKVNSWGIPEPTYGTEIDPLYLDYVLVPLLAVNHKGHRVGYGKGFYDRFLADCNPNCKTIGLNYFEPIDEISDLNEGDIALNGCVSPLTILHF